jgi:hypothetical protein
VIRRGLWLAAGAVLGVAGYRRATRLVDGLLRGEPGSAGQLAVRSPATASTAAAARPDSPRHRSQGRLASTAGGLGGSFPRAGTAGGLGGSSPRASTAGGLGGSSPLAGTAGGLGGSSPLAGTAGGLGGSSPLASTAARIGAAAVFVRDVRDGVAEYLELHHRELARNLGGRSNRTSSPG